MLRRTWLQGWIIGTVRALTGVGWSRLMVSEVQALQTGPGALYLSIADYPALQSVGGSVEIVLSVVDAPVIVNRASETLFYAVDSVCTHAGCKVGIYVASPAPGFMLCPCHGSKYNIQGQVVRGPAEANLTSFITHYGEGGELRISLPSLPVDAKPAVLLERRSDSVRLKLTFKATASQRYELRYQSGASEAFEAVAFAVTPYGPANRMAMTATSDGLRHLYVDATSSRGFYVVVELE